MDFTKIKFNTIYGLRSMVALLVRNVLLRLLVHCSKFDSSRQFRVGGLDNSGELCGYGVDSCGNLGVKYVHREILNDTNSNYFLIEEFTSHQFPVKVVPETRTASIKDIAD